MRRLGAEDVESSQRRLTLGVVPPTTPLPRDPAVELEAQRDVLFEKARLQGQEAGLKDATAEIARQVAAATERMEAQHREALATLKDERESLRKMGTAMRQAAQTHMEDAESIAVEVALAAVHRLLGDRLDYSVVIREACRQILQEFGQASASLRVGERDHAILLAADLDVPLVLDRRLAPGQCVLDTPRGQFETGLDVRLEAIKQALLNGLQRPAESP